MTPEAAVDIAAITALLPNFVPSATLKPAIYELNSKPITMTAAVSVKLCIPVVLLKLVSVKTAMQAKKRERPTALNASVKLTLLPVTIFVEIFTTKRTRSMSATKVIVVLMGAIAAKKINAAISRRISMVTSNVWLRGGL
jgi:hypothetical protein